MLYTCTKVGFENFRHSFDMRKIATGFLFNLI